MEHIIIIGGGGTGAALAHDLTLRGFEVSLFERGEFLSGTTGRHHGLLHSGARYAVHDPAAARECIQENRILREIAPEALEQNDGLFVALDESDLNYRDVFLTSCRDCGIPARELTPKQALSAEPALNPALKLAVQVPDATIDAWRLPMHFFATAAANGARLHNFSEVVGYHKANRMVTGVRIFDHQMHREYDVRGDIIVNAAGAWSEKICHLAGIRLPLQPGPGVMVAVKGRLTNMVVNRLNRAGEADVIVPQRRLAVLGTTLWLARDPDNIDYPRAHAAKIVNRCAEVVPAAKAAVIHSVWAAARPLLLQGAAQNPQQISRTFDCFDHKQTDQLEGLVSIIGGKATTLRAMAEKAADLICSKTGRNVACRTKTEKLLHYRMFYKRPAV
jgi:glycerol-3-phosphate dehydrogenase